MFALTEEALEKDVAKIRQLLENAGLTVNPAKEARTAPGGNVDISGPMG